MSENSLVYKDDDISVIEGNKEELIVFKSIKDKHSFLELLKLNNQNNNRTLVALHSGENTKSLLAGIRIILVKYFFVWMETEAEI